MALIAQDARQEMLAAERSYAKASETIGLKQAALQFFAKDTVIFQPDAVNGKEFWVSQPDGPTIAVRSVVSSDISATGFIGYTTGSIEIFPKGKTDTDTQFGNYVTIWGRREGNTFRPIVEITTRHDKSVVLRMGAAKPDTGKGDTNKRNRSSADSSMNFLRSSMGSGRLGGAYKLYASDDIRFLRDGVPPIIGRKRVAEFTKDYVSVQFPTKVALIESGDMAYSWNPCHYTNYVEGSESGNCLHVWKLRDKKWWIVLGVYSRVINTAPPVLTVAPKTK